MSSGASELCRADGDVDFWQLFPNVNALHRAACPQTPNAARAMYCRYSTHGNPGDIAESRAKYFDAANTSTTFLLDHNRDARRIHVGFELLKAAFESSRATPAISPGLRGGTMIKFASSIKRFLVSEDGPTAVEYAVMLALIIVVCLTAIQAVGTNASTTFSNVSAQLGGS
jgi:pilus assembly protein Flp/PilA